MKGAIERVMGEEGIHIWAPDEEGKKTDWDFYSRRGREGREREQGYVRKR